MSVVMVSRFNYVIQSSRGEIKLGFVVIADLDRNDWWYHKQDIPFRFTPLTTEVDSITNFDIDRGSIKD